MRRLSFLTIASTWLGALALAATGGAAWAGEPQGEQAAQWRGNVYQRQAFESMPSGRGSNHSGNTHYASASPPQINAGWFQRPYPYHLDYYRMRYGGSYEPYFGNLYGPPQVVTAPPYYGPYYNGYGYGGFGYGGPAGYGYPNGYGQVPYGCPCEPNVSQEANGANSASNAAAQSSPESKNTASAGGAR